MTGIGRGFKRERGEHDHDSDARRTREPFTPLSRLDRAVCDPRERGAGGVR